MTFLIQRMRANGGGPSPGIDPSDRGFLLGDGVFDTMTAAGGIAIERARHQARLLAAASAIGITIADGVVDGLLDEVLAEVGERPAILRTTVTRGIAARGLWPDSQAAPTVLVTAQPWDRALIGQPARLVVASSPRNQRSPLSRIKSLGYLDNILAARQASEGRADDALILNLDGHVACSTIANVFAWREGALLTPPLADGCLDGIVRALVLAEAREAGTAAIERSLSIADLVAADGVFLTNSVRLIRPVLALSGAPIPDSPHTRHLLELLVKRLPHP